MTALRWSVLVEDSPAPAYLRAHNAATMFSLDNPRTRQSGPRYWPSRPAM